MHLPLSSISTLAAALMLVACGAGNRPADTPRAADAVAPAITISASLAPFGEGYPTPGDPCRRLGESAATVNWLDDSAILIGCPTLEAAARLGGKPVATVEGVTIVSIGTRDANAGMVAE